MAARPGLLAPNYPLTRWPQILRFLWLAAAIVALLSPSAPASAQSFDCRKAQNPLDRAICASARLRQLDADLAAAFAAALARDATQADAIRQAQRAWAKDRMVCMSSANQPADRATRVEECLARVYADRVAALAPPPAATAGASTQGISTAPDQGKQEPRSTTAAIFAAPRPATGLPRTPAAAATLERDHFGTAGETAILLHVTSPGRFAIRAQSQTGTALQLVDMLTGPGERAGWPGKQDGRIDALLETGTYKLRAFGDPAASGDTSLTVAGFTEATPAQLAPEYQPVASVLSDLQFQSFWLVVPDGAATSRIEAAGRSLAALKLWRDGRDLVAIEEQIGSVAVAPAHPMTDIVLSGPLPPGTYLVTAYGGPKLPWADGAADEPFYLRTGRSNDLLAGGASGQVGVFGTEIFDTPPDAARALLILPQPATAHLSANAAVVDMAKTDRARAALLDLPAKPGPERIVTLQAAPGQAFILRPLAAAGSQPDKPGRYWFGVAEPGNGGDEVPAAAILTRLRLDDSGTAQGKRDVLAAPGVPAIGPGKAWRTRFNLRGNTTLLFHATAVVTAAVHAEGPPVTARITTLDGAVLNAMGDGRAATTWALSPGWYTLVLTAKPDAVGVLDLTLGPPGIVPPTPEPPGPESPVLSLGEQAVDAKSRLALLVNRVPNGMAEQLVRAVPLELSDGPLIQTLAAGESSRIEVHARDAGLLVVRDVTASVPISSTEVDEDTATTVTLPSADHARTLAVALLPPSPSAAPEPATEPDRTTLRDGEPAFLDLGRDDQASFALTVGRGGLYRVETFGRLKTTGRLATAFIPELDHASANGVGNNMLLQRYLRAGHYRLDVTATDSAGRLGVSATGTPLADGAELLPGGSARATLAPGGGIAFPIRIASSGRYHLDVLGNNRMFTVRLEDAEQWPLRAAGALSSIDQDLSPGRYRLIVQPQSVEASVITRLRRIERPVALTGHGPHALPFDAPQSLEWREPPGRDDARVPDSWTFTLAGPAKATLSLTGDGMAASLRSETGDPDAPPLARLSAGTPLILDLPAGRYRVAASALGRNDRLAYTISLHTDELQPGTPRSVTLPTEQSFAIADARQVTLTSFGRVPVRAELRDDTGRVLARVVGRTNDWNIALSRLLPAGRYRLALSPLVPPVGRASSSSTDDTASGDTPSEGNDSGDMSNNTADQASDQPADDKSDQDQAATEQSDEPEAEQKPARTELTLGLPPDQPDIAYSGDAAMNLAVGGIQHVALPPPSAGSLLVVAAEAPAELILALERRTGDGTWQMVGQSQGLAPILGVPVGDAAAAWRAVVWTVDGGTVPVRFAAHAVTATPAPIGTVPLAPVALGGLTQSWHAALVADPGALMLSLTSPDTGLLAASSPDQPAMPPAGRAIVAQSDVVWLLSPNPAPPALTVVQPTPGSALAVSVPAAGRATLPIAAPATNALCGYVAASGLGQPGGEADRGMGVAEGSAFALCGGATLRAWNAGGEEPLRLRLNRLDLTVQPELAVDQVFVGTLPPHAALPLRLPAGLKRLDASLAAGGALVAGWQRADAVTAWAGDAALTRSLAGDWTQALLINTTDDAVPAALSMTTIAQPPRLAAGGMFRRFYGASGSFALPLTAKPGQQLMLAGDATVSVQRTDGQVRQGSVVPLVGDATAVVTHRAGPLALWIEGPGVSPWPDAQPHDVTLPQSLALGGEAMALRLSPGAPLLLRVASTAPVILAIGTDPPVLFGQGVTRARYLPAGDAVLRLLSPQDGPLSGTLELSGSPVSEVGEGLGAPVAIAPGGAAVFGFTVAAAGPVGLGVRADPDRVDVRLLDDQGRTLERGVSMLRNLSPGHYLLEASVPPDSPTTLARAAVLGILPHRNPPPPDVVRSLLVAAGFTPPDNAR